MGSRGRKSSASLTVSSGGIEAVRRPIPPDELNDEESAEWRAIVARMPADWFARETFPLLVQYCWHVVSARRIRQLLEAIEAEKGFDSTGWHDALKMQQRESAIICSLATKMRISQQSSYDKSKKKGGGGSEKPCDV